MTGERRPVAAGRRRGYALAAAGALAVTIVFATVGDGVEVAAHWDEHGNRIEK